MKVMWLSMKLRVSAGVAALPAIVENAAKQSAQPTSTPKRLSDMMCLHV